MQTQIFIQRRRKKWRSLTKKKFRAFRCIEFLKKIQISGRLCKKKREKQKSISICGADHVCHHVYHHDICHPCIFSGLEVADIRIWYRNSPWKSDHALRIDSISCQDQIHGVHGLEFEAWQWSHERGDYRLLDHLPFSGLPRHPPCVDTPQKQNRAQTWPSKSLLEDHTCQRASPNLSC